MVTRGGQYWQVVFGMAVAMILIPSTKPQECSTFRRCSECVTQNTSCVWCNDINAFLRYANQSNDTDPAPMCGTIDQLLSSPLNCTQDNIINPMSISTENSAAENAQVSLTTVQAQLRPGAPSSFNITVRPAASISVDMYILLDLSFTMRQQLQELRSFARELVLRMQGLTDEFRIAFGSFIDKSVPPFSERFSPEFPCARDRITGETRETCERSYAFRHRLNFTTNATEFEVELNSSLISASPDNPEAVLDAIMQVALCEDEVGWSSRGESRARRLIVAITDGDYHFALDGKLGGIVDLPDGQCHLDPVSRQYNFDARQDYPSSAYIATILNERRIIPIFAVAVGVAPMYQNLVNTIRSAFVGTFNPMSQELLALIERQYQTLSTTVVPVVTGADNLPINVTILPVDECAPGGRLRNNTRDICENINSPNNVTYTVTVQASPELCQRSQLPANVSVQFIGFGLVQLRITALCDCDCDAPVTNSPMCDNSGTLECSSCQCNPGYGAPQCNCPLSQGALQDQCRVSPLDQQLCSGRGSCTCGRCVCNQVGNSTLRYQGDQCQYDPNECPFGRNENGMTLPCSGHGVCNPPNCVCNNDYTGIACDCTRDQSTCRGCLDDNTTVCSGEGTCQCGVCVCNDYSQRRGQFCDECVPCRSSCSVINTCIQCLLTRDLECNATEMCDRIIFVNSTSAVPGLESTRMCDNPLFKLCSVVEGVCEVQYQVSRLLIGREPMIHVVRNMSQSSITTLRTDPNQCNAGVLIWPIVVGIILGIIIVGIIALIVWRCLTYVGEYLEYQEWLKSVQEETKRRGTNPLFVDPNTKYQNPRYRASK